MTLVCALLGGCSDQLSARADAAVDASLPIDANEGGDGNTLGCTVDGGNAPLCFERCGSDFILGTAMCRAGSWACTTGVLMSDCPPGVCWGVPTLGEKCNVATGQWECRPGADDYAVCPQLMCPECIGFQGPTQVAGCACHCEGTNVTCVRAGDGGM